MKGIAMLLMLACLVSAACTQTITTGGEAIEQSKEQAYNVVKPQIQNAVTAYTVDNMGQLPPAIKSLKVNTGAITIDASIFDICAIVGAQGGLISVPDGCARLPGAANDNFDNDGCVPTGVDHHYVWVVDAAGNVFSVCDENLDGALSGSELDDGFHYNIWP
jgi:hypothetical protein